MLHSKKSQSILQWFNSLTTKGDVNSLVQFTDGSHFYEMVASLQSISLHWSKEGNLLAESFTFSETSIACNEEVITSVEEGATEEKMETSVSKSGNADPFVIKDSDHIDIQKKYDVIRKFINDFYHVESSLLIDYEECQNGKELELAKVAVFLLSAMVQNFLSSQDKVVYNTTLLEPEVQENIRECISLVLMEKDMGENQIKKSELHKILSRAASYKGTPIRKQPSRTISDQSDLSDGVKNVTKKRKERTSIIVYEDIQDSPLKNLLESPKIQYKAALFKKESELSKLRGALHDEENKVMDLTLEKKNLNDELEKRKKELEFYKKELESQRETFCDNEELSADALKNKKIEEERVRNLIESQEEEIKQLKESNEALQEKFEEIEKKLEHDATPSLIDENNNLKDTIQKLEFDNEKKSETIKNLNEKVTNLEHDLKMYQQMYQDFSASNSRRELTGSPNVPETLSTIIYADEQSSRETLERKEQELRQDPETKDERVKRLALQPRKSDSSKNKNRNVESLQIMVDRLHGSKCSLERENSTLKEKLECYELKFGPITDDATRVRDLNSFKNESDKIGSVSDDISEINAPHASKLDNKMEGQLWANVSDDSRLSRNDSVFIEGKLQYNRSVLSSILRQLEKRNCIAPPLLSKLKENCKKIQNCHELSACLRDLSHALKLPIQPSVTTRRSRSLATEEGDISSLINKNRNLEQESQVIKQNLKSYRMKIAKKEEELKIATKNFEACNADLKKEIANSKQEVVKLKQEIALVEEKYISMEMLAKKKDCDVKKALIMYNRINNLLKEIKSKKPCGKECEELKKRAKDLNDDCLEFEKETADLKSNKKQLEGQLENLLYTVEELTKEKKELQQKLRIEKSALSNNIAERDALVHYYLSNSKHEAPKTAKDVQLRKKDEQWNSSQPLMKFDRHVLNAENEMSMSNSVLASSSIRNGFFQAADEDDFLNESSLAEIHNGSVPEGASGESRLQEIRRRNTLCLPHMQSCYPLEIQNMTPSEKKYYDPEEVSFDLVRKRSQCNEKSEFCKKNKSKYIENDSDDSDDSNSFPVKKRKLAEADCISVPVGKKPSRPSAKIIGPKGKPSTPLKRVAAFVKRPTFKTPVSVHRLMSMPRKSKAH